MERGRAEHAVEGIDERQGDGVGANEVDARWTNADVVGRLARRADPPPA
jgi:hypothetical protein